MLISLIFTEISEDMAKDGGDGARGRRGRRGKGKNIIINDNYY